MEEEESLEEESLSQLPDPEEDASSSSSLSKLLSRLEELELEQELELELLFLSGEPLFFPFFDPNFRIPIEL